MLISLCFLKIKLSKNNNNRFFFLQSINGGGERVRTDDLLRARQALSQLSYTPKKWL